MELLEESFNISKVAQIQWEVCSDIAQWHVTHNFFASAVSHLIGKCQYMSNSPFSGKFGEDLNFTMETLFLDALLATYTWHYPNTSRRLALHHYPERMLK